MGISALTSNNIYTYAHVLTWPEHERWEILQGVPYAMSPAPTIRHQEVAGALYRILGNYLQGKACRVFIAPLDVLLTEEQEPDEQIQTVVQPDVFVVCDKSKLDKNRCKGAPDLIIEVLSPTTARKDRREKFLLYEKHGVKEYWLVEPDAKLITAFTLKDGQYGRPNIYSDEEEMKTSIFTDLIVNLAEVFTNIEIDEKGLPE
ncbi:MAG: Uma2 family endonuclease [Desulfosporosinus sp.]